MCSFCVEGEGNVIFVCMCVGRKSVCVCVFEFAYQFSSLLHDGGGGGIWIVTLRVNGNTCYKLSTLLHNFVIQKLCVCVCVCVCVCTVHMMKCIHLFWLLYFPPTLVEKPHS